jgi:hypothetical protein
MMAVESDVKAQMTGLVSVIRLAHLSRSTLKPELTGQFSTVSDIGSFWYWEML